MIRVDVQKNLRDFPLSVHLEVPERSCLALVGPTGCGKTTTLRIIAGLESPDTGRIEMGERVLVDAAQGICLPTQKRRVGVVFQDYALFPHMTVLRNVMYGAAARGVPKEQAQRKAREAIAVVELAGMEQRRPGELSGGQQQRTALARALASDPEALLMDEPMAALDTTTRRRVRGELRALISRLGIKTIIVTHDAVDALSLGDVICVMENGQVVQAGNRKELLSRPRNQFVAEFIGVNLLPCKAAGRQNGLCMVRCGAETFFTADDVTGDALLTCNPWDISLSHEPPEGSALNVLKGKISELSHIGGRTRVTVENDISITAEITHTSEERLHLSIGTEIYASFKASAARVYT